jgi:hypothetical protein
MHPAVLALSLLLLPITFLDIRSTKAIAAREGVPVSRIESNPIIRGLVRLRVPYAWEISEYAVCGAMIGFVTVSNAPAQANVSLSVLLAFAVLFRALIVARSYWNL